MNNICFSNVNFCGRFAIQKNELNKLSFLQKAKFLKQKENLADEFCKKGTSVTKTDDAYIIDIKDEKENEFLAYTKKLGLVFKKVQDEN